MSVKVGKALKPYKAVIQKGGEFTVFSCGMYHFDKSKGVKVKDGFIQVLVRGSYDFKQGDEILIKEITGADVYMSKYYSIYADIEYITKEEKVAEPNKDILDEDIPDDLF